MALPALPRKPSRSSVKLFCCANSDSITAPSAIPDSFTRAPTSVEAKAASASSLADPSVCVIDNLDYSFRTQHFSPTFSLSHHSTSISFHDNQETTKQADLFEHHIPPLKLICTIHASRKTASWTTGIPLPKSAAKPPTVAPHSEKQSSAAKAP